MAPARVLIVDDSLTMRALFGDVLERAKGIEVVGAANGADEAREMIASLRPNVLTLDVEMPGTNGLEFLAELMETRPIPVVMLSTLTQKGATTSLRANELGAVECFPKPMRSTPDEFEKIGGKLAKLVIAASQSNVSVRKAGAAAAPAAAPQGAFDWNGKVVGISTSVGGIEAVNRVLSGFPANCPPTVIVMPVDVAMVEALIAKLSGTLACKVALASDGATIEPGTVYFAADPDSHVVVDKWPGGVLRLLDKPPVNGARPAASLLFASMARAAVPAVGVVMTGMGNDGASGLKVLRDAGAVTLAQDAASAMLSETIDAARAAGAVEREVALGDMANAILGACGKA